MVEQSYKYWAFISYSHQDRAWANWLHKSLETYRVPHRLVGREHWSGPLPRRLMPIFRDRDELPSSAELGSVLNEALRQSRYLIVICSPQSARSRWVNEEVKYFKSLGRSLRVLPLVIGGEPSASEMPNSGLAECMPPAVRFEVDANGEITQRKAEPIAADARGGKDGRATAKLKLIAGLIGVGLDELRQRERQRQIQRRVLATAAGVALVLLAGLGWHWQQNEKQHALQAQELKVRIAQLYENGRQELLAHNEARAAVYLNEAYKLGLDTPALRYMLARAMRLVDAQALRVQIGSPTVLVSLNPDGKRFLSVDRNHRISLWNAENGKKLSSYDLGSTMQYVSADFSRMGSLIAVTTNHSDSPAVRLQIFDAYTGQLQRQFELGHVDSDINLMPVDDRDQNVVYLKKDYSIAIYSLKSRHERRIAGHFSAVRFCNDQRTVMAGTSRGMVQLLDPQTGGVLKQFTGLRGEVTALDASIGCKKLAAGTSAGAIRVWDTTRGEVLMSGGHATSIGGLQFDTLGKRLMSLTRYGVNVWDGARGVLLYAGKFLDPLSNMAAMSVDGKRLASIDNARLTLLDAGTGTGLYSLDGHQGSAGNFSFSTTGKSLISGGADGSVVIWNLPQAAAVEWSGGAVKDHRLLSLPQPPEAQARFNHSGSQIIEGGGDGSIGIWRDHGLRKELSMQGHQSPIGVVAVSPDDHLLASADWDQSICLWDANSGKLLRRFDRLEADVLALSFDSSGRFLSTSILGKGVTLRSISEGAPVANFQTDFSRAQSFDPKNPVYAIGTHATVKAWDITRKQFRWSTLLPSKGGHDEAKVTVVAYSPEGDRILAVLDQHQAFILSSSNGKILQKFDEPSAAGLYVAAFSPDGRSIALGDHGKTVFLWQLSSNTVSKLSGHTADVRAVAFSPDSALLVSGAGDGTFKVWGVSTGNLLDSVVAHDAAISWDGVQFSPSGDQILSSGADGMVRLWNIKKESRNPEEIAAILRCHVAWRSSDSTLRSVAPDSQSCSVQ